MTQFADLRLNHTGGQAEESFWPSFTDIMMVVVMIFLITSATLILRNTELIRQITESEEAEALASGLVQESIAENATLEERLRAVQNQLSMARLQQLMTMEQKFELEKEIRIMQGQLAALELSRAELDTQLSTARARNDSLDKSVASLQQLLSQSEQRRHIIAENLESSIEELAATDQTLNELQQHYNLTRVELTDMIARLAQSGIKIDQLQVEKLRTLGSAQVMDEKLSRLGADYAVLKLKMEKELSLLGADYAILKLKYEKLESEKVRNLGTAQLSEERLERLGAEYAVLKSKYEKLVLPARTTKDKYVVSVRYTRIDGNRVISLKRPEDAEFTEIDRLTMHAQLGALKDQFLDRLYVKIIIPGDSQLSYNEAWSFTRDLLDRYDYYHQGDYKEISPLE